MKKMLNDRNRVLRLVRKAASAVILLTTVAVVAGWRMYCPEFGDDMMYRLAIPEEISSGELPDDWAKNAHELTDFRDLPHTVAYNLLNFSGRLSNIVYIVVRMTPSWLESLLTAGVILAMFFGILDLAYPRQRRFGAGRLMLAVLAFWLLLPWNDHMQSGAFIFNYPFPAALMLLFVWLYRGIDRYGTAGTFALMAYAVCIAPVHEAFSADLIAWIAADCVIRRRISWRQIVLMMIFAGGICMILFLGSTSRVSQQIVGREGSVFVWVRFTLPVLFRIVVPVALASVLMWLDRRLSTRSGWKSRRVWLLPMWGPVLVIFAMACAVREYIPRSAWGGDVFLLLIILSCADDLLARRERGRGWVALVAVLFCPGYALWGAGIVNAQRESATVDRRIISAVSPPFTHSSNIVFSPDCDHGAAPVWSLGMTEPAYFATPFYALHLGVHYLPNNCYVCLVPEAWSPMPVKDWPRVGGNAGALDLYPMLVLDYNYKGLLRLRAGEFKDNAGWSGPFLREIKRRTIGDADSYVFEVWNTARIVMPDSSVKYCTRIEAPESFQNRTVLSIDTLGNTLGKPKRPRR